MACGTYGAVPSRETKRLRDLCSFGFTELARFLPREARRCIFVSADLYAVGWPGGGSAE
jgi:hypothetical protein